MTLDSLITKLENIQIEGLFEEDASLCGAAKQFFSKEEVQDKMLELNQDQLYTDTADRNGKLHNHYAPRTAKKKMRRGQPADRYTFCDSGEFYDNMEVYVDDDYVAILAPYSIDHVTALFATYATQNDLGLSDENLLSLMPDLIDETRKYIKDYLNG